MGPGEPAVNLIHFELLNSTHPSSLHRPSLCTAHTDPYLQQVLSPVSRPPRSGISRFPPVPSLRRYIGVFDVSVGEYTLAKPLTVKVGRSGFQSGRKLWFAAIAFLMNDQSVMHMVESKVW